MVDKVETKPNAPVRPKRKPVGIRQRLNIINQDPNRAYRLIDADPDRISMFVDESGWRIEKIKDHLVGGQRTDVPGPTDNAISVGKGKKQILVSIEREFYEEDQAEKAKLADAKEAGIKNPQASEGQYGNVQIKEELRKRS